MTSTEKWPTLDLLQCHFKVRDSQIVNDYRLSAIQKVSKLQQSLDSRLSDLEIANNRLEAERKALEVDIFDNRLIFGDNLLALKALEQEFAGMIKCIHLIQLRTSATIRWRNSQMKSAQIARHSLQVENLPKAPPDPGQQELFGSDDEIAQEV